MKKIWPIIRYYYRWNKSIFLMFLLGLLALMLKIPVSFIDDKVTFILGIISFTLLFLIPFGFSAIVLREMMANHKMVLVPGFKFHAGIAHLSIAVAASVYFYVSLLIFSPDPASPLVMLRVFYCMSLFAGLSQLVIDSKYYIPITSLSPIVLVLVINRFKEPAGALFLDTSVTMTLFLLSVAGWVYGLWLLRKKILFTAPAQCTTDASAWLTSDGGIFNRLTFGNVHSPAGTLLLGYPDGWSAIIARVLYYFLITPLMTVVFLFLIGFAESWDQPMMDVLTELFLLFSMFGACFYVLMYGELAARCRLVWLRYGTDRKTQWTLVENYCLKYQFVYYTCAILVSLIALTVTDISRLYILHYCLLVVSYCFFNIYFSLAMRANNWGTTVIVLVSLASMFAVTAGIITGTTKDSPSIIPIIWVETVLVATGVFFRESARRRFLSIDWKQVTLKKSKSRYVLTQD